MTFSKTTAHKLGETPGGRYAQNSRWPPLKTKTAIYRLIVRAEPIVIPLFQPGFFRLRNTFLKSILGFNYISGLFCLRHGYLPIMNVKLHHMHVLPK